MPCSTSSRSERPEVFAIGSRIALRDGSNIETNWTSLAIEQGLVQLEERDPAGLRAPQPAFYCGGGCSLFQTRLLRHLVRDSRAYDPFYWEDVEWGSRARKFGYQNVFCPASIAHHRRRATVRRFYDDREVERIFERNRLLFQMRNSPAGSDLRAIAARLARTDRKTLFEVIQRLPESLRVRRETAPDEGAT